MRITTLSRKKKVTNKDLPTEVVADEHNPGMFRLKWDDGVLSEDMYNWTRANDIFKNYLLYRHNMSRQDPTWLHND